MSEVFICGRVRKVPGGYIARMPGPGGYEMGGCEHVFTTFGELIEALSQATGERGVREPLDEFIERCSGRDPEL